MIGEKLHKALLALFSTQVIAMGMGFAAHLIMVKTLSASEYGVFSFVFSIVTLLCLIGNFGFQASAVRAVPQVLDKASNAFANFFRGTSLFVLGFASVVSVLVFTGLSLSPLATKYPQEAFWIGAAIVPFFSLIKLYSGIFKGLKKGGWALSYESTFKESALVLLLIGLIVTGVLSATGQHVLALLLGVFTVLAIAAFMHVKRFVPSRAPETNASDTLKTWLKISYPMMFVIAAQTLIHRADIIMLGVFMDTADVGAYGAAAKLSQAAMFGFVAMNIIFSPLASEYFHSGKFKALKQLYTKTATLQFVFTAALACGLFLFGESILNFFGPDYAGSLSVLYLLLAGYVLNCVWGPIPFLMIMTKFEHQAMWITFAATALNIALNIVLIPIYGILGAAIATVITLNLRNAVSLIYVLKHGVFKEGSQHGQA